MTRSSSLRAATFVLVGAALLAACGSRGPLDDAAPTVAAAEAGAVDGPTGSPEEASVPPAEAAAPDATADAGKDAADGGIATAIECGQCLFQECSQGILACVQDEACRTTFQCVVSDCLSGGTPNPACLLKCASGDPKGALQIFGVFQCVTGTCGQDCNGLLGTVLGGLGGGGGSGGGATDAGKKKLPKIAGAFARWPELCPGEEPLTH